MDGWFWGEKATLGFFFDSTRKIMGRAQPIHKNSVAGPDFPPKADLRPD
jgi:hypothetical protein